MPAAYAWSTARSIRAARLGGARKAMPACEPIQHHASFCVTTPFPIEANSPSVDSPITTRSMPRLSAPTIGIGTPGNEPRRANAGVKIEQKDFCNRLR